jgi:hypothetical protein
MIGYQKTSVRITFQDADGEEITHEADLPGRVETVTRMEFFYRTGYPTEPIDLIAPPGAFDPDNNPYTGLFEEGAYQLVPVDDDTKED